MHDYLLQIALISAFSILSLWMGWRFKIPSIVFFMLSGFLLGPTLQWIEPEALFGDLLQPFISLAVGIILFEGSLTLDLREFAKSRRAIRQVVLIGAPVAWLLTTMAAHYVAELSWAVSITLGALLIVTGPTVIMPLLKNAKLKNKNGAILKWEGIVNDPIGAILAVLSYEYFLKIHGMDASVTDFFAKIVMAIIIIAIISIVIAYCLKYLFNNNFIPEYLKSAFTLCTVVIFYTACNEFLHESGLIGVTILGIALANIGIHNIEDLKKFKESISLMLISGLFIILTARINPQILLDIAKPEILFVLMLLFVIRPITAWISSIGTGMTWREKLYQGWIAPRGIVCAAIAGLMGPQLYAAGYEDGQNLLPLAFAIVLLTVFLHGFTAKPLGRLLGLSYDDRDSLIIVGASAWTIQLAEMLKSIKINVLIADSNWHSLKSARLNDIETYYGEILSEATEHNLEFNKYSSIFAATYNIPYNTLICNKFAHDMGRNNTYQILAQESDDVERKKIRETLSGRYFAKAEYNYWDYNRLFKEGWRFKATHINEDVNSKTIEQKVFNKEAIIIGHYSKLLGRVDFHSYSIDDFATGDIIILFEKGGSVEDKAVSKRKKAEQS